VKCSSGKTGEAKRRQTTSIDRIVVRAPEGFVKYTNINPEFTDRLRLTRSDSHPIPSPAGGGLQTAF
jgi:hypothetical protein